MTHSYGGIIAKEIVTSESLAGSKEDEVSTHKRIKEKISENSRGIVFFGTPHRGSPFAGLARGAVMDNAFRPAHSVSELLPGARGLELLDQRFNVSTATVASFSLKSFLLLTSPLFVTLAKDLVTRREQGAMKLHVASMAEGMQTAVATLGQRKFETYLVPPDSAYVGVGRFAVIKQANHLDICKPPNREDPRYVEVRNMIAAIAEEEKERKARQSWPFFLGLDDTMYVHHNKLFPTTSKTSPLFLVALPKTSSLTSSNLDSSLYLYRCCPKSRKETQGRLETKSHFQRGIDFSFTKKKDESGILENKRGLAAFNTPDQFFS